MKFERMSAGLVEVKLAGPGADTGTFSGYGSVFNNTDGHGDMIVPGAFSKSLGEWKARGKWPKMLLQHGGMGVSSDDMMPIGKWTHMEEDARGLRVEGRLFALNTERGQYIYEGLKSGELDSLSIGYRVRDGVPGKKPGDPRRTLTDIDLWEVSIVTFPANDKALISSVKSMTLEELREFENALRDEGISRSDAKTAVSVLKNLRRDAGGADDPLRDAGGEVDPEAAALLKALNAGTERLWTEVFRR